MAFRSMALYPPAGSLVAIHCSCADRQHLETAAQYLRLFLEKILKRKQNLLRKLFPREGKRRIPKNRRRKTRKNPSPTVRRSRSARKHRMLLMLKKMLPRRVQGKRLLLKIRLPGSLRRPGL